MKKALFYSIISVVGLLFPSAADAAVNITKSSGWYESAYVEWDKEAGYSYNVYVSPAASESWTKLDNELVREYPAYGRADALGLAAGSYKLKVVPVQGDAEVTADAAVTEALSVVKYDRGGFAHFKSANSSFNPANGIGAYKNDGTLKAGAKVFYVTADNAATITTDVVTDSKGKTTTGVGLQDIITLYQKGYDKTPLDFRIIGTVKKENLDRIDSSAEGLQIKGKNSYSELNITIEGVGKDATVHGFGFLLRNACSVELRNFASMWCMDDGVSMDTDNTNIWIHHLDLFYGKPGSASDQAKGDGTIDVKGDSQYITISYNHLWDSGKSSLCGMTSESGPNWISYHHNWFDHSDSRHPRIRTMSVHVYNNYYDGNSKYGVGAAKSSNAFVENNYFRNCKYPMLISKQGSDVNNGQGSSADTKGTFSGEDGGMIKAYGNYMTGQKKFQPWAASGTNNTHFDAYVVSDRSETVPSSVSALQGGRTYDNFDTNPSLMYTGYQCDAAADVPGIVKGDLGAGRCNHGDFSWTFGSNEDTNDAVISALSTAIQNYKSTLVGFFGKTISNGGATNEQGGNSNEGNGSDEGGAGDDGGEDNAVQEETYITGELAGETMDDYYWFNEENKAQIDGWLADGTITLVNGTVAEKETSKFNPAYTYDAEANGKTFASTEHTGALTLAQASAAGSTGGGSVIFKCPKGVTSFAVYLYRTGSHYLNVYKSTDGEHWNKVANVDKAAAGILEKDFSSAVFDKDHCVFIKIENTSSGGLNIQGIHICNEKDATEKEPATDEGGETGGDDNPGGGETGGEVVAGGKIYSWNDKTGTTTLNGATEATLGSYNGIKFGKNADYVQMTPVTDAGGFKAGDIVYITGYAEGTDRPLVLTSSATSNKTDVLYTTPAVANKKTSETPQEVSYTLTAAYPSLYVWRGSGSTTFAISLYVVRPETTGIDSVISTGAADGQMYDLFGRRITAPRKGQIYIINGKKMLSK